MIFSDERELFSRDKEKLANMLANKTSSEIEQIFDSSVYQNSSFKLTRLCVGLEENCGTMQQRLLTVPVVPLLFIIAGVKWVLTGQMQLDSWARKYKFVGLMYKMIGYEV